MAERIKQQTRNPRPVGCACLWSVCVGPTLLALYAFSLAQPSESLPPSAPNDTFKYFLEHKLSVETGAHTSGGGGVIIGQVIVPMSQQTWSRWQAYQGGTAISEPDLFRVAGYPDKAKDAEAYFRRAESDYYQGMLLTFAGLLGMVGSVALLGAANDDCTTKAPGIITGLLSTGVCVYGIVRFRDRRNLNWAPFSMARDIADDYNHRLSASLCVPGDSMQDHRRLPPSKEP